MTHAWLVADTEDMSTNAALRAKCYWPNIQTFNNTPKPAKLVNRTTGTSGKYANEILSHLFEPFFRKLDTESSDCNSGKDVSKVYFFKDRPTLSISSYSFKSQNVRKLSLIFRMHFSIYNDTL